MRKAIAAQMTKALQVPVAYTVIEIDMSGVVALRDKAKGGYQAQEGISLTYDAFVAKATVEALRSTPISTPTTPTKATGAVKRSTSA